MSENIGFKLTKRELEVMQILWHCSSSMTANEIANEIANNISSKKTSIFTVQNLLQSLLKKGAIQVSSYTRVNKATAREYTATLTDDEYAVMQFSHYFSCKDNSPVTNIVATLLKHNVKEKGTIEELEKLLAARKTELMKENETD